MPKRTRCASGLTKGFLFTLTADVVESGCTALKPQPSIHIQNPLRSMLHVMCLISVCQLRRAYTVSNGLYSRSS
jgi:hypothetical protein